MRINARDVMQRQAAPPMPGAPQGHAPAPAPAGPGDPMQDPTGGAPGTDPMGGQPGQEQQGQGQQQLSQITQALLRDYFDDAKINDASSKIQQLIPLVGPEHAEKFVKVYTDWVKSAMTMKANLMAMVVMATPQQMMQNQVQTLVNQLMQQGGGTPGGPQPIKSGPLT